MAGALCDELPAAKALFDKASGILGYDLLEKCKNGPKEELDSTVVAQTAIFVSSMAALEKLKATDPAAVESCTVAMGLSLGEYTALCFAGAFSFEDGVKLTKARGEAMQAAADASSSGMVAVIGLDIATVEKICAEVSTRCNSYKQRLSSDASARCSQPVDH
jgi:[acyl-carrier-protein] S-malonyltransferase